VAAEFGVVMLIYLEARCENGLAAGPARQAMATLAMPSVKVR